MENGIDGVFSVNVHLSRERFFIVMQLTGGVSK